MKIEQPLTVTNPPTAGLLKYDTHNSMLSIALPDEDYAAADILGNLAVDDTTIQSSSNKDIVLSPDGTGKSKVMGIFAQKGVANGYTGSDIIRGQTAIQTTNNTSTTLLSVAIPLSSPATMLICRAAVGAIAVTGTSSSSSFDMGLGGAYYNGATVVALGTLPTATSRKTPSTFAASAVWVISGSNLILRVTGVSGQVINWLCSYEYYMVTTSTS